MRLCWHDSIQLLLDFESFIDFQHRPCLPLEAVLRRQHHGSLTELA